MKDDSAAHGAAMTLADGTPCPRALPRRGDASTGGRRSRRPGTLARLALLAAVLAVAACSSIRLGYNNADTLALYALDSYFDLDDAQESQARERVRTLLAWHRRTQLNDYAQFLDTMQRRLDSGVPLTGPEVLALQDDMSARLMTVARQAAPEMAVMARTLTPEQLAHFDSKLAKDSAKLRRERVAVAARDATAATEERIKRNQERVRRWLGPLTREQEQLVREAVLASPGGERAWLDERERRQRQLLALLTRLREEPMTPEAGAALLNRYFAELNTPTDPARREAVLANRAANADWLARLLNTATAEQKARLMKTLRGYAQDFTVLANEGARS